ncbi:MAG: methyltransferase type 11 [Nitrospirae bacterium GWC2_42_7]|nr:MAG: methyltransferase type 11 [Nitrospirae bacterium GWC2_42_7]
MSSANGIIFGTVNLACDEIKGKSVIELGARNVNGSLRPFIVSRSPAKYIGVDIEAGEGVDVICNAEKLLDKFERNSFNLVISTELLEHVREWKKVISNIKNLCCPGGILLITTRSIGFKYHGYPFDYWRYEVDDIRNIFSDFIIERIERDTSSPGVLLKARKPHAFSETDLSGYELYSIIAGKRVKEIEDAEIRQFMRRYKYNYILRKKIQNIVNRIIWIGA